MNISLVVLEIEIVKVEALRKKARPHRRQRRRKRPPSRKSPGSSCRAGTATWARQRDRRAAEVAWMTAEELPEDPWELLGHLAGGPGGGGRTGQGSGRGGTGNPGSIWTTSGRILRTRQGEQQKAEEDREEQLRRQHKFRQNDHEEEEGPAGAIRERGQTGPGSGAGCGGGPGASGGTCGGRGGGLQ